MTPLQPILVCLLLIAVTVYFRKLRSRLADRVAVTAVFVVGVVLVAFPEWANRLADLTGVGRGADLLFYMAIPGLGFAILLLVSKVLRLESQLTALSREVALQNATDFSAERARE